MLQLRDVMLKVPSFADIPGTSAWKYHYSTTKDSNVETNEGCGRALGDTVALFFWD